MDKKKLRLKRRLKIRSIIKGMQSRPRLAVFRSNRYIYAQIINDDKAKTLIAASEKELEKRGNKKDNAYVLGKLLAKKAAGLKIKEVVFDRGGYSYHGRVDALAKGAREGGLVF